MTPSPSQKLAVHSNFPHHLSTPFTSLSPPLCGGAAERCHPVMDSSPQFLEINLISCQNLKPPPGPRRTQCYAVVYADPAAKVRTHTDPAGGENPTWNDRFVFRVPASFLHADSPSALTVHIYAAGGWCLPESLVGTVRLLLSNHRLLDRPPDTPVFVAVGVRRPSGRFHGILNIGATRLSRVPALAAEALILRPAVSYRDIMEERPRTRRRKVAPPPQSPVTPPAVLKELNSDVDKKGEVEIKKLDGRGAICGVGISRRVHLSPSDENTAPPV